ncbi:hypothetical protein D3C85_1420320 [compost metagenome]
MTSNHAGGRARRVEQDALETLAIPPGGCVARIGGNQLGVEAQAFEVFLYPHQAFGFQVDCNHALELWFGFQ